MITPFTDAQIDICGVFGVDIPKGCSPAYVSLQKPVRSRGRLQRKTVVSISEANQNFSRVARLVDEKGAAIILKNNAPRYILLDYNLFRQNTVSDDFDVDVAASRILSKHIKAFEELVK